MRLFQLFESMMGSLASIPGLSFLYGYVVSAKAAHTRFGQRKGDYEAYVNNVRTAAGDVREATGRPRKRGGDAASEDDDSADPREFDDAYYDLYDEPDDSVYADSGLDSVDDYPASDERHSYYDDDYRTN